MLWNRFVAKEVPTSSPLPPGAGFSALFRWICCFRADAATTRARSALVRRAGFDGCSGSRSHRRKTGGCTETGGGEQHGRCSREGGKRPARLSLPAPPLPPHLRPCVMTTSLPPRALLPALSTPPCLSFFCRSLFGVWNLSSSYHLLSRL